ncbi:MAG: archaeal proteasome endopeptidase complex subunit alpha [archaeon]
MYPSSPSAYDRAITVFSPDGRLFQVEYARESVKIGATALGMIYKDGVLLSVDKNITSSLLKGESIEKIFKIDDHIAAATSGLVADARRLIDTARMTAQEHRLTFNEPVDVSLLTREVCDLKQGYTQWGGVRPFGAALIITGVDDTGKHLFETDPSGAFNELYATAIGSGSQDVKAFLEKEYRKDLGFDDAVQLSMKALTKVGDKKISKETVDLSFIEEGKKKYAKMSQSEIEEHIQKLFKKK